MLPDLTPPPPRDPGALHARPYVLIGPMGLRYVGLHTDEADCWRVALGWPSEEEIAGAKRNGFRVFPAEVTWQERT